LLVEAVRNLPPANKRLLVAWIEMQSLEELPFVAGNAGLDFVNTAELRGHPQAGDVITTATDLRRWGQRYGLLSDGAVHDPGDRELGRALEARELLYAVFVARIQGRTPSRVQLDQLAELAGAAYAAAELRRDDTGAIEWRWRRRELSTIRHTAVTEALPLLAQPPTPRLKQCPGDQCGWLFLDATKRGNRRWCEMRKCGQEAKDDRRRQQRRSA
jgi:predicted RNA-binding Zn ribbon-like protein